MAFYLRIIWVVLALIVAPPYSNLPEYYKVFFPITGVLLFVAVLIWVAFLNYKYPKLALYGDKSHFEEWKVERKKPGSAKTLSSGVSRDQISEIVVADE